MASDELYRIVGDAQGEMLRARVCIRDTLAEAQVMGVTNPDRLAEVVMARLVHLEPSMLIVSLEEVDGGNELNP